MFRQIAIVNLLALLILNYLGNDACAAFKCGREIIRVGYTTMDVLIRCGPPTFKEVKRVVTEGEYGREYPQWWGSHREVTEVVETWYYNCGPHRFIQILRFRGGILERIRVGRYGSGESDCIGAEKRREREEARARAGEVKDYNLPKELEYGRISIYGHPHFAEVYLDGRYVGDLPCTVEDVEPGSYDLMVTNPEYRDWEKKIKIEPGETLFIEVYLDFRPE